MASLDFPASPTVGQLFSAANGVTYSWTGTLWLVQAGPGGGTGDFFGTYAAGDFGLSIAGQALGVTVITGNSGGWYNAGNSRYTPPAGRFYIWGSLTAFASGGATTIDLYLQKNSAVNVARMQASSSGAGIIIEPVVSGTFDANGTDYFQLFVVPNVSSTGRYATFGAFPLTGMQGPQGPSGSMLINGTGAPTGLSAAKGTLYINTTATTTTTRLYINTDGATTWANFTASA